MNIQKHIKEHLALGQPVKNLNSLEYIRTSNNPASRIPIVRGSLNAYEGNLWHHNGSYYIIYTASSLSVCACADTKDPLAGFIANASFNNAVMTVHSMVDGKVEPGMWVDAALSSNNYVLPYGTGGTTGRGGIGTYQMSLSIGVSAEQRRSGSHWGIPTRIIGGGYGGMANVCAHSSILIDGETIYCYYQDLTTGAINVSSAALSAPTVWTPLGAITGGVGSVGTGGNGNPRVIKVGTQYYLFQEAFNTETFPVEGSTVSWQMFVSAPQLTPTGLFSGFTLLTSLRPGPNASASNIHITQEADKFVAVYHSETWGRTLPSETYCAVCDIADIGINNWRVVNNKAPILEMAHDYDVDQAADPRIITLVDGSKILTYTGGDNHAGGLSFHLMATRLTRAMHQYDFPATSKPRRAGGNADVAMVDVAYLNNGSSGTVGTWDITADSAAPGGFYRSNTSNAQNNAITFDTFLSPGTYQLTVRYRRSSIGAINTVSLSNGTNASFPITIGTIDTYAASPSYALATLSFTVLGFTTMRRYLRFYANTRNASSTGWTLGDCGWSIRRTSI